MDKNLCENFTVSMGNFFFSIKYMCFGLGFYIVESNVLSMTVLSFEKEETATQS